jgi:hypothetical protein
MMKWVKAGGCRELRQGQLLRITKESVSFFEQGERFCKERKRKLVRIIKAILKSHSARLVTWTVKRLVYIKRHPKFVFVNGERHAFVE